MKKALALFFALFLSICAYAQIDNPVKWAYAAKKTGPAEVTVFLKATMDNGWHIYSQKVKDGGPIRTSFAFTKSRNYTLAGPTVEPKAITRYDKNFKMELGFFEREVIFQQKIKLKSAKVAAITGTLEYMTCNDLKCRQPEDVSFSIPLSK
jgi:hypothetical protein